MEYRISRQLGVFGPRNSGKTTFWACLYASKGSADGAASFPDEQTRQQLDALWCLLSKGSVAPATAQGKPTDISFQFHSHAISWQVSTRDYSGSLVELSRLQQQPTDQASRELRRSIADWIGTCDAMLVLVPADLASQDDGARLVFRRAMESLLAVFNNSATAGPLPICIAVTKSDMLPNRAAVDPAVLTGEPKGDLPAWLEELAGLVRHQVGDDNAKVFLTSAFGGHDQSDPARPPTAGPVPKGLEQPLNWALQQSDRCLLSAAAVTATTSLDRWPHKYSRAIRYCERVVSKGLPQEGMNEVAGWLEKLTTARRRQSQLRFALIAASLIAVTVTTLCIHAKRLKDVAMSTIAAGTVTLSGLSDVRDFVESSNPTIPLLFWGSVKNASQWHADRIKEQSGRVHGLLAHNSDTPESHWQQRIASANARIEACESFCQLFPTSSERLEFEDESSRASKLITELERYGPFDKAYATLMSDLRNTATSGNSRTKADAFRTAFAQSEYPLRSDAYDRLESVIESKAKGEQYAQFISWEARIRADYAKDPSLRSAHLEEIGKWLAEYETDRRGDLAQVATGLKDLRRTISLDWDTEEYGKLKTSAGLMFASPDKLEEAIAYGDDYLKSAREVRAMQTHVRDWLAYARALQVKQRIGIMAMDIAVANSKFAQGAGGVEVRYRTRDDKSGDWNPWVGTVRVKPGSHPASLGGTKERVILAISHGQIEVDIEEHNYIAIRNDKGSQTCDLLTLVELFQQSGKDEARCERKVNGATVTIALTDLPKRINLPDYEKSR